MIVTLVLKPRYFDTGRKRMDWTVQQTPGNGGFFGKATDARRVLKETLYERLAEGHTVVLQVHNAKGDREEEAVYKPDGTAVMKLRAEVGGMGRRCRIAPDTVGSKAAYKDATKPPPRKKPEGKKPSRRTSETATTPAPAAAAEGLPTVEAPDPKIVREVRTEIRSAATASATLVRTDKGLRLRILTGAHTGVEFAPYRPMPAGIVEGDLVRVAFDPADQFAHITSKMQPRDEVVAEGLPTTEAPDPKIVREVKAQIREEAKPTAAEVPGPERTPPPRPSPGSAEPRKPAQRKPRASGASQRAAAPASGSEAAILAAITGGIEAGFASLRG